MLTESSENSGNPFTLKREELYAQVWSTPMIQLAKKYGLSDRGLAKACKKLEVPPNENSGIKISFLIRTINGEIEVSKIQSSHLHLPHLRLAIPFRKAKSMFAQFSQGLRHLH